MSGIAAYKAQVKIGGTPTLFIDEPLVRLSALVYRITDPLKRVISPNHAVYVQDDDSIQATPLIQEINYLEGIILFSEDPDDTLTAPYTLASRYIPLSYIGGSKEYSLDIAGDVLDATAFHTDSTLSAGFRERINGIHDVSASVGRWNNFNGKLLEAKLARTSIFVSVNPGASKLFNRGWFHIETDSLSGDIGALEEEMVSLALAGNNSKTYFSSSYNWSDIEAQAMDEEDLIANWFIQ